MRSGRLNKRIQIARQVETTDAHGERLSATSTFASRWASIEPINGREYIAAIGTNSKITTQIRIRHDSVTATIAPSDLVIYGQTIYDIEAVINSRTENRELLLMCQSGVRNNAD